MSKVPPIQQQLPSAVVENNDWLSNAFPIVEGDDGALSPFDLTDIFPQPAETIPNTNSNNSVLAPPSIQTTTTTLGKHALPSEVAAATTKTETTTAATTATNNRPAKKVKKSVREKARRDALNDRFDDLSKCLQENPDDELKTDKSSIVIATRACILVLRVQLEKLNACLAAERSAVSYTHLTLPTKA